MLQNSTGPAFNSILEELNAAGTDRGIAGLGGSFMEGLLTDMLARTMVPGKETDQFLRKTSAYVLQKIAFLNGVIPKSLHEVLETISLVRNAFAHRMDVKSFDSAEVKKLIEGMHAAQGPLSFGGPIPAG